MSHFRYPSTIQQELFNSTMLKSHTVMNTNEYRCWICFGDSLDSQGEWIKACQCSLEAHESCLLDWIAENQKTTPNRKVKCPQCSSIYQLVQENSLTLSLMTKLDSCVRATTPYIAGVGLGCSLFISCTTYGAYAVMTFCGIREGERLLGNAGHWCYKTWIGLPLIPFLLISSKTRYGDTILPIASISTLGIQSTMPGRLQLTWPLSPAFTIAMIPWVRIFYKKAYRFAFTCVVDKLCLKKTLVTQNDLVSDREIDILTGDTSNLNNIGFAVIGTLLWPMISSGIGDVLYRFKWVKQHFPEQFQRSVLGGCLFIIAKDIIHLLYRYERIQQHRSRRIQSYSEQLKKHRHV